MRPDIGGSDDQGAGLGPNGAGPVPAEGIPSQLGTPGAPDVRMAGLALIQAGINSALDELNELDLGHGWSGAGRGFSGLALRGIDVGNAELTAAFSSFCERWEWGVRELIGEGNQLAEAIGLSAGTMWQVDQHVEGAAKAAVNAAIGNPNLSEQQVQAQSWDALFANHAVADPTYDADSFREAQANSEQAWRDAGRDAMTSPLHHPIQLGTGQSDSEYRENLDGWFGPSAEDRARQGETPSRVGDPDPSTYAFGEASTGEAPPPEQPPASPPPGDESQGGTSMGERTGTE